MICASCGKENAQDAKFCISCGAKLEAQPQESGQPVQAEQYVEPWNRPYAHTYAAQPAKKRNVPAIALGVLSVVLAAGLVLSMLGIFGAAGASAAASKSFATPEEAIYYFVGCLKKGDFDGALAACGINETAKGFNYKAYLGDFLSLPPVAISYMPSEYEYYVEYNRIKITQRMLMQMTCFMISFNLPEMYASMVEGKTELFKGEPDDLIAALDPAKISGLEIIKIGKARHHDDPNSLENHKRTAKMFGADDRQFRSVLYKYDGSYYVGGFMLLEYGGRWYINSMEEPYANVSVYGTPRKISGAEEFENILE